MLPNDNEVRDIAWVSQDELKNMFNEGKLKFTPWFKLICDNYLFDWWNQLDDLQKVENDTEIHRML